MVEGHDERDSAGGVRRMKMMRKSALRGDCRRVKGEEREKTENGNLYETGNEPKGNIGYTAV